MSTVKGTKSSRLMVVPYRPYIRALIISAVTAAVVISAIGSFILGNAMGIAGQTDAIDEVVTLQQLLDSKTKEAERLSQEVANLSLAREVDQASTEDVRGEVIGLKQEIAALQEDISFYRGLMTPTDNKSGLTIGSVELSATAAPRRYGYKVVIQQLATNHQLLNGSLTFNIIGREGELVRVIPLKELSDQVEDTEIRLRFKYFQNIEGQLELPVGFEPERIELIAKTTGRDATVIEKKTEWSPELPRDLSRKAPNQTLGATENLVQSIE